MTMTFTLLPHFCIRCGKSTRIWKLDIEQFICSEECYNSYVADKTSADVIMGTK